MRNFGIILKYELKEYVSNKAFMIVTILLTVASAVLLFLPRFFDMSSFTGVTKSGQAIVQNEEMIEDGDTDADEDVETYLYYDKTNMLDKSLLETYLPQVEWMEAVSEEEISSAVQEGIASAGFVVLDNTSYVYYVYNKEMFDNAQNMFDAMMREFYCQTYCAENGYDYAQIRQMYDTPIQAEEVIFNKDSGNNYWYCYALVIIVFVLIVLYGQMIAVSVTSEKSNRAIEVLVTSTTPSSLLFGKVIAGAIGGLFQAGIVMGALLVSYQCNRTLWGGMLDFILQIPASVIVAFALFGIGGYFFYAFIYGAIGALCSKTEDISKASSGLVVVIMIVYFFSLIQLTNPDGMIMKVLSYLPISSYSTMFARIAMGRVSVIEIVISFIILVLSTIAAGFIGTKIYRMGTLRYGNPIRLSSALKEIRKNNMD